MKSVSALVVSVSLFGATSIQPVGQVQVHEWGTFTSVAGSHGESVAWAPLAATSDLPCFVQTLGKGVVKFTPGLVRMETPVVYFYAKEPTKVSVRVDFPEGWITEWYPRATRVIPDNPEPYGTNPGGGVMYNPQHGRIEWNDLSILPGAKPDLPATQGTSRYFAARATDSASLQSGGQSEKMLFYRGIANFKVPLEPVLSADGVVLRNTGGEAIPVAILFENQNGRIGYRIVRDVTGSTPMELAAPDLTGTVQGLRRELTSVLEQAGLYPKEAAAMVETWHDSWFEDGMRVFYIEPRSAVDSVLPLTVTPAPAEVQRVFVGRVEVMSPWTQTTIRAAMESGDTKNLEKFGRFLTPFRAQIKAIGPAREAPAAYAYAQRVEASVLHQSDGAAPCVK
jgi:hypothetical protein